MRLLPCYDPAWLNNAFPADTEVYRAFTKANSALTRRSSTKLQLLKWGPRSRNPTSISHDPRLVPWPLVGSDAVCFPTLYRRSKKPSLKGPSRMLPGDSGVALRQRLHSPKRVVATRALALFLGSNMCTDDSSNCGRGKICSGLYK